MNLVLFDFDGTLTSKDSLMEFLKYSVKKDIFLLNMFKFLPYFLMWKLKIMKNDISKQKLFEIFFLDLDEHKLKKLAKEYSLKKLDNIIISNRLEILKKHQKDGDRVIIVSASMRCWLEPWCEKNSLELLSTELEFKDSKFTGKFKTKNCHAQEKVNRVKKHLNLKDYDTIYAYGDSSGDKQMLAMSDNATKY